MANQISVNSGSGAGAQQVIVDTNGNISVTVSRSVIGTVANVASANYANFAGNVVNGAQPNITSVGNLTSLTVTGTTTTGNLNVLGNLQVGNLVANSANYANFAGIAYSVNGANVSGTVANAVYAANAGNANIANTAINANTANVANVAYNVSGANVTGAVANATYAANAGYSANAGNANIANTAYSVSAANVSGLGNIATINLDGNVANVLKGNGTFGPEGTTGNANYANFAGTAFSVSGSNVSGAVANATYADNAGNSNIANTAYAVSGANVSGTVANATYAANAGYADNSGNSNFTNTANIANTAYSVSVGNVSGIGNIATVNLDGNSSNVLKGDGTFGPEGSTGNANYANFAGTAYSVSGSNVSGAVANATFADNAANANIANIAYSVDGANVSGTVANATYALDAGNANIANTANIANIAYSVDGANVSGAVANATFANDAANANIANIAYSVDVANVSGIGNIATINLDGNVSNALLGDGTFGAVESANANYANFAGNAFAVDGANVNGAVANATYAANSGNSNIANTAYSVSGSNVSGIVAEANVAQYANVQIANTSITGYSVALVDWIVGNHRIEADLNSLKFNANTNTLSTVNFIANNSVSANYIIGNGSNLSNINGSNVTGTVANATYAANAGNANIANTAYSVSGANVSGAVANANYATYAGTVLTNAQPNITSVGNLVNLTIDANIANSTTVQFDGNLISFAGENAYTLVKAYDTGSGIDGQATQVFSAQNLVGDAIFRTRYYADNAKGVEINYTLGPVANISDPLTSSGIDFYTYGANSNTANANTLTFNQFSLQDGFAVRVGYPIAIPALDFTVFGDGGANTSGIRFRRRGGNNDARTGVVAGTYLGNIDWQGASTSTGGFNANATIARIAPKVESTYGGAGTGPIPTGVDLIVSNGTTSTHNFHANGNITFSKSITANLVTGTLATAAQPNVTSVGTLTGLNVSSTSNIVISTTSNLVQTQAQQFNYLSVENTGNIAGGTVQQRYNNPNIEQLSAVGASDTGISMSIGNTNPGNAFPGNLKGVWRFQTNGNLDHIIGGSGQINAKGANITGNILATQNVTAGNGNVVLNTDGTISYLRSFGNFSSNLTQASNGANSTNYITLNNTADSNGVSVLSSTQISVTRAGRYNIQFSAQFTHDTNASANVEIWLVKNATNVANSNTRLTLLKDQASVAAWNWVDNAAANTYYEIAWASSDTNVEILAVPAANTIANVAIPSAIVTVVPVGA